MEGTERRTLFHPGGERETAISHCARAAVTMDKIIPVHSNNTPTLD